MGPADVASSIDGHDEKVKKPVEKKSARTIRVERALVFVAIDEWGKRPLSSSY